MLAQLGRLARGLLESLKHSGGAPHLRTYYGRLDSLAEVGFLKLTLEKYEVGFLEIDLRSVL